MAARKKTGGRQKGTPNKANLIKHEIAAKAVELGVEMVDIMRANARHFMRQAEDAEAIIRGLTVAELEARGVELSPAEQFNALLAEVKKAAGLRMLAQKCASDAAPFGAAPLKAIEAKSNANDTVPLADRLKEYAREEAIASSAGKVVEIPKKRAKR